MMVFYFVYSLVDWPLIAHNSLGRLLQGNVSPILFLISCESRHELFIQKHKGKINLVVFHAIFQKEFCLLL